MKTIITLVTILLIILVGVPRVHSDEEQEVFSIYISQQQSRTNNIPLSELKLSNQAFLTYADIVEYRWNTHELVLTNKGSQRYKQFVRTKTITDQGFVVVADGIRCYYGGFWLMIWSIIPPYPVIFVDTPKNIIAIQRVAPFTKGEDLREDKRIYKALKRIRKLKEVEEKK